MTDAAIRPAEPADARAIRHVGEATWHAAYDDILGPEVVEETVAEWWDLEGLRAAADREDDVFLVAEDDRIVGVAHAGPDGKRPGVYGLGRLYVLPDRWGEGIGTALLDELCDRLPNEADRLRLIVLADNEVGVSFYESYGFERVDTRTGETNGVEHEEHVYALDL